jgi:chromosome segregation ATPase
MSGRRASLIWLIVLLSALAVLVPVWLVPRLRWTSEQRRELERLASERTELAAKVDELSRDLERLRTATAPEPPEGESAARAAAALTEEERARRLEQVRLLAAAQEKLAQAASTIVSLEERVHELEQAVARITEENKRLAASEADLTERLASSNRIVESMREELKSNAARLVRLETQNRSLNENYREAQKKLTRAAELLRDLEGIHQRQEALLAGLLQRYREINDQLRSSALRRSNLEEREPAGGLDLSRIDNIVSLAEEDLRQLQSLNARAARIRNEMPR